MILSEGNGKRTRTSNTADPPVTLSALIDEALARLPRSPGEGHGDIKIEVKEVKFETHEHNYFVLGPESAEERQYTALSALAARPDPEDAPNEDMRNWRREVEHFKHMKSALWKDKKLRHKFVAIHDGKVVDHDGDKFALARRVSQTFPGQVVLVTRVQRGARVVEMPSPEMGE